MIRRSVPPHRRLRAGAAATVLTALLAVLTLSGCESKAGVAGFVGSSRIETSELNGLVERGSAAAGSIGANRTPAQVQDFWFRTLIEERLAEQVAQDAGIRLGPTDVAVFQSRYVPLLDGQAAVNQRALRTGAALSDLTHVFRAWALEDRLASKVAPGLTAPASDVQNTYAQLRDQYPGETLAQIGPDLGRLMVFTDRQQVVLPLLQQKAVQEGVRINPRFGTWDPQQLLIAPPPDDLSSAVHPSPPPVDDSAP